MTAQTITSPVTPERAIVYQRPTLAIFGNWATHYSLVVVFLWFGALKFTDFEASAISPLVMNSPLVMWWHELLGIAGTSKMLGLYEIATALLLAFRPVRPILSVVGAAMATLCFVITVSFLFTTPGVMQSGTGSPLALSPMPGQFLLKDIVLLWVSLWILGLSLSEMPRRR